ncbi:MAG: polysaccharide deacetylase family protein [Candidatus Alcyoniella australis]|nr:polysaccharide deacetylase family protein [Candidatus Alcyoniella australis]
MKTKRLLITFDVEEFDLPQDLGLELDELKAQQIARGGAEMLAGLIRRTGVAPTCFVSGSFAKQHGRVIKLLSGLGCEIACHGALHSRRPAEQSTDELTAQLTEARAVLEKLSGRPVAGFRSPRFEQVPLEALRDAGFSYDSSIHPTWVPGRYNHLIKGTRPRIENGIVRVPVSVTPLLRLPASWVWFRNYPGALLEIVRRSLPLGRDAVVLYFHNWELVDLAAQAPQLPSYIVRRTGHSFVQRLSQTVERFKKAGFVPGTMIDYVSSRYNIEAMKESG